MFSLLSSNFSDAGILVAVICIVLTLLLIGFVVILWDQRKIKRHHLALMLSFFLPASVCAQDSASIIDYQVYDPDELLEGPALLTEWAEDPSIYAGLRTREVYDVELSDWKLYNAPADKLAAYAKSQGIALSDANQIKLNAYLLNVDNNETAIADAMEQWQGESFRILSVINDPKGSVKGRFITPEGNWNGVVSLLGACTIDSSWTTPWKSSRFFKAVLSVSGTEDTDIESANIVSWFPDFDEDDFFQQANISDEFTNTSL